MRFLSLFLLLPLLASYVDAGSQLWEASHATSKRTDDALLKRAASLIANDEHDNAGAHRWPDKTISYAFSTDEAKEKLEKIFEDAKNIWNQLIAKGFKYKKLSLSNCRARRRECLMIHYNDQGKLRTTVGLRPLDEEFEGPNMHLSDKRDVGNLNRASNAAHELGHAWGLWHEHQVPKWWGQGDPSEQWGGWLTGTELMTEDYHCENLKDYEEALDRMAEDKGLKSREELDESQVKELCRFQDTAEEYGFNAFDWVPSRKGGMKPDETFDRNSLMLYPSGAGGKGEVIFGATNEDYKDERLPVLTFPGGERIPTRERPTGQDIEKLIWLYGTDYVGASRLHNDGSSPFKGLLKKIRSKMSLRAGDTEQGMC
ncbi:zinc-dependent metalloprotease [Fusarium circinatum]|uniref:Zinc-dependent metalloprotease n=1 Tax=Fusarium circinatum TaxID=48490 RepID=A0A8H5TBC1_FUSCI|nr:zinc-dependent metalloprotease [Fusarium circinatum]